MLQNNFIPDIAINTVFHTSAPSSYRKSLKISSYLIRISSAESAQDNPGLGAKILRFRRCRG